jgi:four helix bundle protein
MLDHERLDVYQRAIEFVALAYSIGARLPRGHAPLADQLGRAATSIPLNIAEGSGKPAGRERARFYGIARGSAMECGAILDVVAILELHAPDDLAKGKAVLVRVVSMLTKMCR